jgi:hypothetical protein
VSERFGQLTVTCFVTLDDVVQDPHLWSGAYPSEDTGLFGEGSRHDLKLTETTRLGGGMLALRLGADR